VTGVPAVFEIAGVPRDYAWGSTTAIQSLLGLVPDGRPLAELWFGGHPDSPSPALSSTLDELIAADPVALLGQETVEQFGPRLPFLLKVLAADKALSIQVHPTIAQAQIGFAAEDAAGLPRDAPNRNYRDPNHKPELICAVTPFEALCGFRPVAETLDTLAEFGLDGLAPVVALLQGPDPLQRAFTYLLTLQDPAPLVHAVTARAAELDGLGAARAVLLAAADFPGDVGVALALLLNYLKLAPGEAIFLGAGNVHAYLRGLGIEIMANSDNVLRCGLTPKHIDVPELLKVTDFTELAAPRWPAQTRGGSGRFQVPVPDFALAWMDVTATEQPLYRGLPQIVLCTDGTAQVNAGGRSMSLAPGGAAFVAASATTQVSGSGRVFVASIGI